MSICMYIFVCACMFMRYVQLFMHACGICFCVVCSLYLDQPSSNFTVQFQSSTILTSFIGSFCSFSNFYLFIWLCWVPGVAHRTT